MKVTMESIRLFKRLLRTYLLPQLKEQPHYSLSAESAREFLLLLSKDSASDSLPQSQNSSSHTRFFRHMLALIPEELKTWAKAHPETLAQVRQALHYPTEQAQQALFSLFFPEGLTLLDETNREQAIHALRQKRLVSVEELNPDPLVDPLSEMIFTSNLLITSPLNPNPDDWFVPQEIKPALRQVQNEAQLYWYDHPIPMGMTPQNNEAVYGLNGLQEMLKKEAGAEGRKLTVLLSASATHAGLRPLIKPYFDFLLSKVPALPHLNMYIFTEDDVRVLLETVLKPIAERHFPSADFKALQDVLGVDGEYGRHYSFLKAIAAFWQVFLNPYAKATFKIDLDQVFPQDALKQETGKSALEHFKTPLWGAMGRDSSGQPVELGMLAGALVNQNDISKSLFTSDVRFPGKHTHCEEQLVFYSQLPQAQSTMAEMMTRYDDAQPDGKSTALQRIHVTGGTNGILLNALRKHRPFTPTFVGRAEDQSYIMSVLFGRQPALRYVHEPGLIMRHDKEAFAGDAIKAASAAKIIGDYLRILTFTEYARALPWPEDDIKKELDPFTGAFISRLPYTVVSLRFALKILEINRSESARAADAFARLGSERLNAWMERYPAGSNLLKKTFKKEQQAWKLFYDILDRAEQEREQQSALWLQVKQAAQRLAEQIKMTRAAYEN